MKMTVEEIVAACEGTLLCGSMDTIVTGVSTDSRKIGPGMLFVPIKGARTDAHDFIPAVFSAGAAATLTQNDKYMSDTRPWIAVKDTQAALQKLAAAYRARFDIPVVGITGSVGKTTTKEMVALTLAAGHNVMKTLGNFNSQVGLPLTLFRLLPSHTAAVIEMGMSGFGEMAKLARVARPQYAVITNIGISHLEMLKTQGNILQEKLHIIDAFGSDSTLFLNGDDALLRTLCDELPQVRKIWFGTAPWCDFCAQEVVTEETGSRFTLTVGEKKYWVSLPAPGLHNVSNALAGLAVAHTLGVDMAAAVTALKKYQPLAMRQQIHKVNDITVIDDSYNSSPDAVKSSVQVLCALRNCARGGRCVAVLADMLELGGMEEEAHFSVGCDVARAGVDTLLVVGERAKHIARGALSIRPDMDCRLCEGNAEATSVLMGMLTGGDVVLIKGSRGMKTDEIVRELL